MQGSKPTQYYHTISKILTLIGQRNARRQRDLSSALRCRRWTFRLKGLVVQKSSVRRLTLGCMSLFVLRIFATDNVRPANDCMIELKRKR